MRPCQEPPSRSALSYACVQELLGDFRAIIKSRQQAAGASACSSIASLAQKEKRLQSTLGRLRCAVRARNRTFVPSGFAVIVLTLACRQASLPTGYVRPFRPLQNPSEHRQRNQCAPTRSSSLLARNAVISTAR